MIERVERKKKGLEMKEMSRELKEGVAS